MCTVLVFVHESGQKTSVDKRASLFGFCKRYRFPYQPLNGIYVAGQGAKTMLALSNVCENDRPVRYVTFEFYLGRVGRITLDMTNPYYLRVCSVILRCYTKVVVVT
jgi:hypothetical protein